MRNFLYDNLLLRTAGEEVDVKRRDRAYDHGVRDGNLGADSDVGRNQGHYYLYLGFDVQVDLVPRLVDPRRLKFVENAGADGSDRVDGDLDRGP